MHYHYPLHSHLDQSYDRRNRHTNFVCITSAKTAITAIQPPSFSEFSDSFSNGENRLLWYVLTIPYYPSHTFVAAVRRYGLYRTVEFLRNLFPFLNGGPVYLNCLLISGIAAQRTWQVCTFQLNANSLFVKVRKMERK